MGDYIWFAMAIPVLVSVILYFFFNHKVVWWEFVLPFVLSIVLIGIGKLTMNAVGTIDTEYWGGMVTEVRYYEAWDEYVHKICTRQVYAGSDSKGRPKYRTETYDCSYVDRHPEYWKMYVNTGEEFRINKSYYSSLVKQFGQTPTFKDMGRNYHSYDGDMYWVKWDKTRETSEPVATVHRYKNKVQVSDDVFNFAEVDTAEVTMYGLYDYPKFKGSVSNSYPSILGVTDKKAQEDLHYWNGVLGPTAQCRFWILVYDYPTNMAGMVQEAYWKGGNKNEFVLTIGVNDDGTVNWCYPFTWSEVQSIQVETRTFVEGMGELDLTTVVNHVGNELKDKFIRKEFADFEYIKVRPPNWLVITIFLVVLASNIGISFFVVKNDVTESSNRRGNYRRRY